MLDLEVELRKLVTALNAEQVDYALCGGLALAVHGLPRATVDVDLLVSEADVEQVLNVAKTLGYVLAASPVTFAEGCLRINRVSKVDAGSGDFLPLDLLSYDSATRARIKVLTVDWDGLEIRVVDRSTLAMLKNLRGTRRTERISKL